MMVPDGPGEAPAGLPGGCKLLFFPLFYHSVSTLSMHLAFWLMLLALRGVHVATEECRIPRNTRFTE